MQLPGTRGVRSRGARDVEDIDGRRPSRPIRFHEATIAHGLNAPIVTGGVGLRRSEFPAAAYSRQGEPEEVAAERGRARGSRRAGSDRRGTRNSPR
ncbi:hypothetical protein NDU88_001129 [Pleurodeles waltl]|uniref:Uncharacterized protein n=1 Tax=Pleurodeles waltl TaxID=8319 RepID=A0AAV7NA30_PLEWA|nr:hypothetical protein NDU88_001129 [Pleurodeles waltl]